MPPSKDSPYRLLVEGPADQFSVINLMRRHGYDWDDPSVTRPYVEAAGGIDKVLRPATLRAAVKSYQRLGIVLDADLSPTRRWSDVRQQLAQTGVDLPEKPVAGGVVVPMGRHSTRFGLWMMPDNQEPGALEHFLSKLVPSGDLRWPHAAASTETARTLGAPLREQDLLKGTIHAWLAWQKESGQPFGQALTTGVLGHDSPEARDFVNWFGRLF